jgi:putative NADH-flavin reductase
MKLAILGATGYVGKAVVRHAIDLDHQVKVLARTPEKLGELQSKVDVIQGALQDQKSIEMVLQGCDAVINASGGVKEPNQYEVFLQATRILMEAMKKEGVKKLVSINGAAIIFPNEQVEFKRKIMSFIVGTFFKPMKEAKLAEMSVLFENMDMDWVSVRATQIVDQPGTGRILANDQKMLGMRIMLPDLAKFMVEQVSNSEWIHKAPMIATEKV